MISSCQNKSRFQGPAVQSIVSLTSSIVVNMLTVLVSTISYSQVFLMKICEKILHMQQMQKLLTFFSKNISVYAIRNDQNFNNMLLTTSLVLNN